MGKSRNDKKFFGGVAVAAAYIIWGFLTIFWNLLTDVNPVYILAQRIIWSMVFMGLYIIVIGKWNEIKSIFKDRKALVTCFVCGVLITINWGVYIYAVNSSHVLDASLGYFIEPILVALIGLLAFREKLSVLEKFTFAFSVAGLIYMVVRTGVFPTLALLIAFSFAVYGAVKKNLKISPQASLFMETLFMTPFALMFVAYAETHSMGSVGVLTDWRIFLLPACGIVTSIPLLLFNIGVKNIPYYFSGILMYINPTIQFFMGLFYFNEPLNKDRLISFVIIWIGILFTVADKIILAKKQKK